MSGKETTITEEKVERLYRKLDRDAESGGYHLNPDAEFTKELARGLLVNEERYGYPACPCRLASGDKAQDRDVICPCDYRDPDLVEHGACYCALYVSGAARRGEAPIRSIPERRPPKNERARAAAATLPPGAQLGALPYPVFRCTVCGYLCARDAPPEVCPICKAKKDRFERFL